MKWPIFFFNQNKLVKCICARAPALRVGEGEVRWGGWKERCVGHNTQDFVAYAVLFRECRLA